MHGLPPTNTTTGFALYYGHARTPLALVVPDTHWSGMWRIAWPDGRLSDMVNLARAKDAAAAIAERGPPARDRLLVHWKASNSPPGGAYARFARLGLPEDHPEPNRFPVTIPSCCGGGVMTIHTTASLRATYRRLAKRVGRIEQANAVLAQMRQHSAALHLQHAKQGPCWALSNGAPVPDSIARLVIASASVTGVGDALFRDCRAQTYRWWNAK
jgi:hypothetical protein